MSERSSREQPPATAEANDELRGIDGWLLIVAFGQVFGPLLLLVRLASILRDQIALKSFQQFPLAAYGEVALHVILIVLAIVTAILFFLRSRYFPRFFICALIATVVTPLLATVWIAVTLSAQLDEPFRDFLVLEPEEVVQLATVVVIAAIWVPYTVRSQRVKNTFDGRPVRPAPPTPMLQSVVQIVIIVGAMSLLSGIARAIGGVSPPGGMLLSGVLQIALGIWLFRGSNAARIILAVLYFTGFAVALALPMLAGEREPLLIVVTITIAAISGVCCWILTFSKRLREEMAINETRYRPPAPEPEKA